MLQLTMDELHPALDLYFSDNLLPFLFIPSFCASMGQTLSFVQSYAVAGLLATLSSIVALALFLVATTHLKAQEEHKHLPSSLPWIGRYDELFASIRANMRGVTESASLFAECYQRVSTFPLCQCLQSYSRI
jgi:hypothetical protein